MFSEPRDLDRSDIVAVLEAEWDIDVATLRYEPVGFGTHHYFCGAGDGTRWFVNVDDVSAKSWISTDPREAFNGLQASLGAAVTLRDAGLGFVQAPVASTGGRVLAAVDRRYALSVYAFLEGEPVGRFGEFTSQDDRLWAVEALSRIHASNAAAHAGVRKDAFDVPLRRRLLDAMDELSGTWNAGPYAEPTRRLLVRRSGAIRDAFDFYDGLVAAVQGTARPFVVTHGEPHAANVMRSRSGDLLLIDWDTVLLAPPERDIVHVSALPGEVWTTYSRRSGHDVDDAAISLYRLWWALAEITGYVDALRSRHDDDANTREAWKSLEVYVAEAAAAVP